jgi:hypothetical protein
MAYSSSLHLQQEVEWIVSGYMLVKILLHSPESIQKEEGEYHFLFIYYCLQQYQLIYLHMCYNG